MEYEAPDPKYAEFVDRVNRECREEAARLERATPDEACLIATDSTESQAARMNAMCILFRHRDPRVPDIQLRLLDDPNQDLWKAISHTYRTDSPELRAALYQRLHAQDPDTACHAAIMLARFQDGSILPTVQPWLQNTDREWRNAAMGTLKHFKSPAGMQVLTALWNTDWGDDEDRLVLALNLVEAGHVPARENVTTVATAAKGAWSVACATQIYFVDPRSGLQLMLHIFDSGDLEAKQNMVGQVSSLGSHLPHAYTYDGLAEARLWVEQQLASLDSGESSASISKELELRLARQPVS